MADLQELIFRGRFAMADAPERLAVFDLVNGKRNTQDIAKVTKRHVNNIRRDLTILADIGLIQPRNENGKTVKVDGFPIYEKIPLARAIPLRYFQSPARLPKAAQDDLKISNGKNNSSSKRKPRPLSVPTEQEILDIAKNGENQLYEFKGQGTDARKITREIAAMLNTSQGGIVFYGIDDDGNIEGSDVTVQKLDQPLQNSIKNSISPAIVVRIHSVTVMGSTVIVIVAPPWNKKDVYQFDEKILIRKGTNVFAARPEEVKQLHAHKPVI